MYFFQMTGSPLFAKKRLQFNMPLMNFSKINVMKNLPNTLLPLFWVEEVRISIKALTNDFSYLFFQGIELNTTFTKQLNDQLFRTLKIVKVVKWIILLASLGGLGFAGFLFYKQNKSIIITPVNSPPSNNTVNEPQKNVISLLSTNNLVDHKNTNGKEVDKY